MGEEQGKELERLRADLEVFERYGEYGASWTVKELRNKIAALEAEADPWREAKKSIDHWRNCGMWPDITGLYDHLSTENARLEKRVAELEDPDVSDPDRYTLGDFAVLKTAQEIIRYAMDRNPDRFDDTRICRRAIAAIADFAEKVRHWRGLKNQLPYRWGSLGRDTAHLLDLSFDVTEPPGDYDPDLVRPIADMQPPFEGPIVGIEPILDPARVLATAAIRLDEMQISGGAYLRNYAEGATPYRMSDRVVPFGFDDGPVVELKRTIATVKYIVEAAGWLETADHLKRFLAEMGGKNSIPYRTKGEINELA